MKKMAYLLSILSVSFLLMGCQKETTSGKKENSSVSKEVTVYLVRHGKTMLNTTDRSQGWIDAPLTPAGVSVAKNLGKGLADVKFDAVYSSDSGRAIETATHVLKKNGQEKLLDQLITDERLREFNFGTYEGLPNEKMWTAVANEQGLSLEEWQTKMTTNGFVNTIKNFADTLHKLDKKKLEELGKEHAVASEEVSWQAEDYQTVIGRAKSALNDIVATAKTKDQQTVLVTSHGMTIASLVTSLDETVNVPPTGLKNASVCKIVYKDGMFTVASVNDLTYVEKGMKE
ncbi:histidine phosphatase family protein [Enterococcus ratti]|uniref:Phosphoglycerate mutase family n=1 Tax=Enterococcus ratti TaxID=150033 RepID=A0A1L8WCU2_9ENTE|nr:histidine phosphatase family protein [Enterococcus ratti]OJG78837.1 Phosphoglycerate mutase family [Enterococcus ratti]